MSLHASSFSTPTLTANQTLMSVDELYKAGVANHTSEVLVKGRRIKHEITSGQVVSISVEDLGAFMVSVTAAAWEQL